MRHNYRNSSFIVDHNVAMGQIPRSTERISSSVCVADAVLRRCSIFLLLLLISLSPPKFVLDSPLWTGTLTQSTEWSQFAVDYFLR